MAYVKKPIKEEGIIISKFIKKATSEWTDKDGRFVAAQPEKKMLTIVSSCEIDKNLGFDGPTLQSYEVDAEVFQKAKIYGHCRVKFYMDNAGKLSADSVELIAD